MLGCIVGRSFVFENLKVKWVGFGDKSEERGYLFVIDIQEGLIILL